jgi:hypothetical protein
MESSTSPPGRKRDRVLPAEGLKLLTWFQVETIDDLLAKVCEEGEGELRIIVKRGLPRIVQPQPKIELRPTK